MSMRVACEKGKQISYSLQLNMESEKWTKVHSQDIQTGPASFWTAIDIWWLKPHVVNRRLSAAVEQYRTELQPQNRDQESSAHLPATSPGLAGELVREEGNSAVNSHNAVEPWHCHLFRHLRKSNFTNETATNLDIIKGCIDSCLSEKGTQDERNLNHPHTQQIQRGHREEDENESAVMSEEDDHDQSFPAQEKCLICVRKLLAKRADIDVIQEIGILDRVRGEATFIVLCLGKLTQEADASSCDVILPAYKFLFQDKRISLLVNDDYKVSCPSLSISSSSSTSSLSSMPTIQWLGSTLLPKLAKWACQEPSGAPVQTRSLVPMDQYTALYQKMKQKYGVKFVEIWPETTDPLKFVYEDVAIATYIMLLFEAERREMGHPNDAKKQSFVDLGCGNGLLVHILNSEGYPGKGIDLRRRKIWDLYGPDTNLEENAIIASMETSYGNSDWLIGNHSDELTPWIPVMAARSSYKTRYFVLPCCFHDFDSKFNCSVAGQSHYRTYLDFVSEAGKACGFEVEEDKMRIPSTKRICHVGRRKTYPEEEHSTVLEEIRDYVASRCNRSSKNGVAKEMNESESAGHGSAVDEGQSKVAMQSSGNEGDSSVPAVQNFAPNFIPRAAEEKVKNCSRVDWSLRKRITHEVAWAILEAGGVMRVEEGGGEGSSTDDSPERKAKVAKVWRKGGSLSLGEVVKLFDSATLKSLKSECGGLKTLLKNCNQVFQIIGNQVTIKDWSNISACTKTILPHEQEKRERERQRLYKTRPCWFYSNHPDGCPRTTGDCNYAHGQEELRERPAFGKGVK